MSGLRKLKLKKAVNQDFHGLNDKRGLISRTKLETTMFLFDLHAALTYSTFSVFTTPIVLSWLCSGCSCPIRSQLPPALIWPAVLCKCHCRNCLETIISATVGRGAVLLLHSTSDKPSCRLNKQMQQSFLPFEARFCKIMADYSYVGWATKMNFVSSPCVCCR